MPIRYFVNFEPAGGSYDCLLRECHSSKSYPKFPVRLGADDAVTIKGETVTLGALIKKLAAYDERDLAHWLDDRGQLLLGSYLFDQIFQPLTESQRVRLRSAEVEVRIVANDDEHLARLPWAILAEGEVFLTAANWSVALSASEEECIDCMLPPSPRLLMVTPQPTGWADTEAAEHIAELELMLAVVNPLHAKGKSFRVVESWEDFKSALISFRPHIVYFYGHGTADENASRLVFAAAAGNAPLLVPAVDFAALLRSLDVDRPIIAYINCCKGEVGGLLGVGLQLRGFIPAVITNSTVARVDAAREQAKTVWKNILINGSSPHQAMISMRRPVPVSNFSFSDVRWITPVLHYRYRKWDFKAPANELRLQLKTNWENMLNRTKQTAEVILRLGSILRADSQRLSLAFLWHGLKRSGVEQFYHRLEIEVQDRFSDVAFWRIDLAWPQELYNFHRSMSDMLTQSFAVADLSDIAHQIRFEMMRQGRPSIVVFLRHPSLLPDAELSHPTQLRNYLEWLDKNVAAHLDESACLLIGLGFEESEADALKSSSVFKRESFQPVEEFEFGWLSFYVLEELGNVERRDLVDFLRTQNFRLPVGIRDQTISQILAKTGGHYEPVLDQLREII